MEFRSEFNPIVSQTDLCFEDGRTPEEQLADLGCGSGDDDTYRRIDGRCNNPFSPLVGSAG